MSENRELSILDALPDPATVKADVVEVPVIKPVCDGSRSILTTRVFKRAKRTYGRRQWHIKSIGNRLGGIYNLANLLAGDQRLIERWRESLPEQPEWMDEFRPVEVQEVLGRGGTYYVRFEWRREVHTIYGWEEITQ